ncbi:MAG: hypothetical protein HY565_02375 [Candidatus Kerfeldbacteria bacterium]|nr:hypothetical protein [Candidatus Kerfeldbacteria bacterium]
MKKIQRFSYTILASLALLLPYSASATLLFDPKYGDQTGLIKTSVDDSLALGTNSPTFVALNLINAALSLLAAVCVGLLLYAGFLWVWARGNQEEVTKAKDIIQGTIIGLVIVLAALGITQFVFTTVADITGATVTTS